MMETKTLWETMTTLELISMTHAMRATGYTVEQIAEEFGAPKSEKGLELAEAIRYRMIFGKKG